MSNIIDQINECIEKNQIEWKQIDEIFDIKNGYTPSTQNKNFWHDGTIPWFKLEDIRSNGNILEKSFKYVTYNACKNKPFLKNSIILSTTATIGVHALITKNFLCNQQFTCFSIKKDLLKKFNIKFVYYYFFIIDEWCKKNTVKSSFPSVKIKLLKKQFFPIPPIQIQDKIVEILDNFTKHETELETELETRKKQYEYYLNKLLDFSYDYSIQWKEINEICDIKRGKSITKNYIQKHKGIYPVYSSQTSNNGAIGYIDSYDINGEYVSWTTDGVYAGTVFYRNEKFNITSHCGVLKVISNVITTKFLFYFLKINLKKYVNKKASQPMMLKEKIEKIAIPIPPIKIQNKIVEILDNFSLLVNDINDGLPKEIELRKKQYEYYLNKLLNFKGEK